MATKAGFIQESNGKLGNLKIKQFTLQKSLQKKKVITKKMNNKPQHTYREHFFFPNHF